MASSLLFALAALRLAAAQITVPPLGNFHFRAAAAGGNGLDACSTAAEVLDYCNDHLPANADDAEALSCYCCVSTTYAVLPEYRTCKSYISLSASSYTKDYSVVSVASSVCSAATGLGFSCGAAAVTSEAFTSLTTTALASATATFASSTGTLAATSTAAETSSVVATTTSTTGGSGRRPAECTSFARLYTSCSQQNRGWVTMKDDQAASCLCYMNGRFTTAMDSYLSVCGRWARTADPTEYPTFTQLQTFCNDYLVAGSTTGTGVEYGSTGGGFSGASTAVASFGGAATSISNAFSATTTSSSSSSSSSTETDTANAGSATANPTSTDGPRTVTITPSDTPTGSTGSNFGDKVTPNGFVAWLAVVLPMALL